MMSSAIKDLHNELHLACCIGDLNRIFQLSYFSSDGFAALINGRELPCDEDVISNTLTEFKIGEYLHAACFYGHTSVAQHLIKLKANMTKPSKRGTPLDIACQNGHEDLVKLLVESGISVSENNASIRTSGLYNACRNGHTAVVELLLSYDPAVVNSTQEGFCSGSILLYAACESGNLELVKLLVKKGVDVNALVPVSDGLLSPCLYAACKGDFQNIVNYLIDEKVELPREIIEEFPHMIEEVLSSLVKKTGRSFSRQTLLPFDKRYNLLTASWEDRKLYAIHESWFSGYVASITVLNLHHNKIAELPENFFSLLPNLEDLDISVNQLLTFPSNGLANCKITRFIANRNELKIIPLEMFMNKNLVVLDLAHNDLQCLPPDTPGHINMEDLDINVEITTQDDVCKWACTSLRILKLNMNRIERIPKNIQGACNLERLNIANNLLCTFDSWKCPLSELDLSGNQLESFAGMIEMVWSKSLCKLNISGNRLRSISWNICRLEKLNILDLSHNKIDHLPRTDYWQTRALSKLNLSHNLLSCATGSEGFADVNKSTVEEAIKYGGTLFFSTSCDLPVEAFKDCLQILDLSDNKLECVPDSVSCLTSLSELDLSNNYGIRYLPYEMGHLRNIWNLRLNNLNLQDLPQALRGGTKHSREILAFLRAKLRKSVPFSRMKLMVVGLQGRGKTTLLATLQGRKPPPDISTVGICVNSWQLQPVRSSMSSATSTIADKLSFWKPKATVEQPAADIAFSTWDLAGQYVYYATHQCFLTSNTLYLVVWNVTHGKEGVNNLAPWLLNIQARAPQSRVITVGTHIDLIPDSARYEQLARLEVEIMTNYDRKGFPLISGNCFVSNTSGEGLHRLRELIYKVACKMQDSNLQEPMVGKKVPLSYLQLYDRVIKESERRREINKPPILTTDEMLDLARENSDNDIYDTDELKQAARFLHDSGILLHFNDQLRGLGHLFFIDPSWLCDMLALVVTVRERNPFVVNGCIKKKDVPLILKNPRLPPQFVPQYLQILERFEIALSLDDEHILVPSMLPKEQPDYLYTAISGSLEEVRRSYTFSGSTTETHKPLPTKVERLKSPSFDDHTSRLLSICRNYHIRYIPTGFWGRLIARIITAVNRWGMVMASESQGDEGAEPSTTVNTPKGASRTTDYSLTYWREGILVKYNAGHFLIQAFKDNFVREGLPTHGIAVTVWSSHKDFSVMGFITDQIDLLITEWFPGLEDVDEYGTMMIQKVIPCPYCVHSYQSRNQFTFDYQYSSGHQSHLRDPDLIHQFQLPLCALAAVYCRKMRCPFHPDNPVPLELLIPDLLLTDTPPHLVIDKDKFEFEPIDANRIGEGGAGEVYRGLYRGKPVAVKQFHSASSMRSSSLCKMMSNSDSEDAGALLSVENGTFSSFLSESTLLDQLHDGKVIRAFWELRQEVAVLCRIQHPCIVDFLGVCRSPLCFVLELAPAGCLRSYLEDTCDRREAFLRRCSSFPPPMDAVLGRSLTYSIALQVAHALMYLHDTEIIYRDLKSDNILVWSLEQDKVVNVKLSDYGISCFATPQGVVGEGGTPGFQAPEVKCGCAYDEKVDIFSYGIWLYELITGKRPFAEHKTTAEIKRAVQRGLRPSLRQAHVESRMPCLDLLMQDCTVQEPASRPSSYDVVARLESVSFHVLLSSLPKTDQSRFESISCIFPLSSEHLSQTCPGATPPCNKENIQSSSPQRRRILMWCSQRSQRKFLVLDADSGIVQMDLPCPGPRVLCVAKVGDRIWLGTEGCEIHVFGRQDWQLPKILWVIKTKDAVTCLVTQECQKYQQQRVFASLANGSLMVFQRVSQVRAGNLIPETAGEAKLQQEQEEWSKPTVVNLASRGMVAKSMVLARGGSELWVGCGNVIVIVDTESLSILTQLKVFASRRSLITGLVSDGARVWAIDRRSANVYEWDVSTRRKTFRFSCENEDVEGQIVALPLSTTNPLALFVQSTEQNTASDDSRGESPELSPRSEHIKTTTLNVDVSESDNVFEITKEAENVSLISDIKSFSHQKDAGISLASQPTLKEECEIMESSFIDDGNANDQGESTVREKATKEPTNAINLQDGINRDRFRTIKASSSGGDDAKESAAFDTSLNESNKKGINVLTISPFLTKLVRRKQPSLMYVGTRGGRKRDVLFPTQGISQMEDDAFITENRPRATALAGKSNRLTSILLNRDTLWVGRATGDVLVINVGASEETEACAVDHANDRSSNTPCFGQVLARLSDVSGQTGEVQKEVTEVIHVSDLIVSAVRVEASRDQKSPRSRERADQLRGSQDVTFAGDFFRLASYQSWTKLDFVTFLNRKAGLYSLEQDCL